MPLFTAQVNYKIELDAQEEVLVEANSKNEAEQKIIIAFTLDKPNNFISLGNIHINQHGNPSAEYPWSRIIGVNLVVLRQVNTNSNIINPSS